MESFYLLAPLIEIIFKYTFYGYLAHKAYLVVFRICESLDAITNLRIEQTRTDSYVAANLEIERVALHTVTVEHRSKPLIQGRLPKMSKTE